MPRRSNGKAPLVRTLDKKEVEEEVVETLTKLDHEPIVHVLDGTVKSLHAAARIDCDLIFNLTESFGGNDTADFNIAAYLELIGKRFTGTGSHGLMLAQDKTVAKKIFAFHGIHTPVFARSFRGRLAFSHDLHFPVIVKPAREDGSIGIEFNAVVSSIKELMERIDWLHEQFDSPVLIEEYIEGREMYVGVLGNENPEALPVIELDLSKAAQRALLESRQPKSNGPRGPQPIATPKHWSPQTSRRTRPRCCSTPRSPPIRRWNCATTVAWTCGSRQTARCMSSRSTRIHGWHHGPSWHKPRGKRAGPTRSSLRRSWIWR